MSNLSQEQDQPTQTSLFSSQEDQQDQASLDSKKHSEESGNVLIQLGDDKFEVTHKQYQNIKRMVMQYLQAEVKFSVGDIVEIDGRQGKILWATRSQMTPAVTSINVESMKIFHVKDDGFIMNTDIPVKVVGHSIPETYRRPPEGSAAPRKPRQTKQPIIEIDDL